jgi:Zn-dependent protease
MRDPLLGWSLPLGRLFGITIRIHWLFPLVAVAFILRLAFQKGVPEGSWIDATMISLLLFVIVLLHEFGHCFGARWMDGDATDILMWPLGGLAYCEVPHTPRANFVCAAAGPAVNLVICAVAALLMLVIVPPGGEPVQPVWNPFWYPFRLFSDGSIFLTTWSGTPIPTNHLATLLLARLFWLSWFLFLLNVVLIAFPLDGGRLFQCILWPYLGFRQSMLVAVFVGFFVAMIVGIFAIVVNEVMVLCLALFIFQTCWYQRVALETGGEESLFGYDFSQGYTSLERDQPPAPRKRQSWWQRWKQNRAAKRLQREQEQREADERRTDELLEKIQRSGKESLTEEEKRFLKRVSDQYRRNRP